MLEAERAAVSLTGEDADCPTEVFVGRVLPGLFRERLHVLPGGKCRAAGASVSGNRRAVLFHGADLFGRVRAITDAVKLCIEREPHILWQFVLCVQKEEPLDLPDMIIAAVRSFGTHFLDRLTAVPDSDLLVSRRVFVMLCGNRRYDRGWVGGVEELLRANFY